jgi:hypothetical protein
MLLLWDDGQIVPGASSETALDQQLVQLSHIEEDRPRYLAALERLPKGSAAKPRVSHVSGAPLTADLRPRQLPPRDPILILSA